MEHQCEIVIAIWYRISSAMHGILIKTSVFLNVFWAYLKPGHFKIDSFFFLPLLFVFVCLFVCSL